jgi:hypothetical protein
MSGRFITTEIGENYRHEEREALLEIVPDFTVGNLKQLYKELTGEVTRSNNKPSLDAGQTAEITRRLEEIGNDGETNINTDDAHDEIPSEDAPEDETTIVERVSSDAFLRGFLENFV